MKKTAKSGAKRPVQKPRPRGKASKEEVREAILTAAVGEFFEHGFGGARVDAIAQRSKINKRFLYAYVGNKEAIWLAALQRVAAAGLMPQATADALAAAYVFLRRVEHRIQYLDDQQTHLLPTVDGDLDWIACSLGLRCTADTLPSIPELQMLVPQTSPAVRGPQAATGMSETRDQLASTLANRRRERTTLWNDSGFLQDSFFGSDPRSDSAFGGLRTASGVSVREVLMRPEELATAGVVIDSPSAVRH